MKFPLRDGTDYEVSETEIAMRQQAYPGIDVAQEYCKMQQWLLANPKKRKTARGINAFICNWLNRQEPIREKPVPHAASHQKFEPERAKVMTKEVGMAALAALKKR